MQLKKGLEQSVCILALLATQKREIPLSSRVIHERIKGSQTYLRKLMRCLVVGGLVSSASGNSGGFTLAHDPAEITLLQIVTVVEGKLHSYPNTGVFNDVFTDFRPLAKEGVNVLQKAFAKADQAWMEELSQITIYQLLCETFGTHEIPNIDWNDFECNSAEQVKYTLQKLRQSLLKI